MEIHVPIINDFDGSPMAEHDMACAVCLNQYAVYILNTGEFQPCWKCQSLGWQTRRLPRWLNKVLKYFYWEEL